MFLCKLLVFLRRYSSNSAEYIIMEKSPDAACITAAEILQQSSASVCSEVAGTAVEIEAGCFSCGQWYETWYSAVVSEKGRCMCGRYSQGISTGINIIRHALPVRDQGRVAKSRSKYL